jgi:hypothetical protein
MAMTVETKIKRIPGPMPIITTLLTILFSVWLNVL